MNTINNSYVYFKRNKKNYENWAEIESHLSRAVVEIEDVDKINNVVNFIGTVAHNERIKELHSIESYFRKFKTKLSFLKNGSRLMAMINNPEKDPNNIQGFYEDFVLAINFARRDAQEFIDRINNIKNNIDSVEKHLGDYKATDYRYSVGQSISKLLKKLVGQYSVNQLESTSLDSKLHGIVIDILLKSNIPSLIQSGKEFASIASIVLIDVEQQAQRLFNEYIKKDPSIKSLEQIADEILPQIKEEYLQAIENNRPMTNIQNALFSLNNGLNSSALSAAIRNTEQIFNMAISEDIQLANNRLTSIQQAYSRGVREKSRGIEEKINALRSEIQQNSKLSEELFSLTFTSMESDSAHGNINELIEGLFGDKVRANVATDIITYRIGYELHKNEGLLNDFTHNIAERLSSIGDYLSSKDKSNEDLQTVLKNVNNELTKTINNLETFIKETSEITDKIFIQHETLKLSVQGEKRGHSFQGREMSIFSYISYLSSAAFGGNLDVNSDDLNFLAYNLIPGAIAEDKRGSLENYFSLFAGMLMFDDVQNMAQEAMQQVQSLSDTKQVEQLHLYNLNGIYVPGSMILQYTYENMQNMAKQITAHYAARARIKLAVNPAHRSYAERAKDAMRTKVKITFLSGFTTLVDNMFSAINS